MKEHDEVSESDLKVSDRRHFTESGERRTNVEASVFEEGPREKPAEEAPKVKTPAAAKPPVPEARAALPPRAERLAEREITFTGLVQDLYATCMMQLGAEMQPGQPGQLDLEGARETIDLIGLLQQKTHGNLDKKEQSLLEAVLYELRLAYVEVQRAAGARVQPASVMPPPPRR